MVQSKTRRLYPEYFKNRNRSKRSKQQKRSIDGYSNMIQTPTK